MPSPLARTTGYASLPHLLWGAVCGGMCCLLVVSAIVAAIAWWLRRRRNNRPAPGAEHDT